LQWLADIFEGNILTAVAEVTGDDHLAEADYHLQNLHTQVKGFIDRFIVEIDDAKKTYQAPGLPYEALADEVKLNFSKSQYNDNRKIYVKLQSAVLKLMPKLYPNLQQLSVSYKTIVYPVLPSLFSVTLKPQIGGAVPSVDEIKHQLSVVTEFLNDEINRNTSAVLDDLTSTFGMIGLLSGMLQDSMASALSGKFGRLNSSAVKDIADMAEKNPQYEDSVSGNQLRPGGRHRLPQQQQLRYSLQRYQLTTAMHLSYHFAPLQFGLRTICHLMNTRKKVSPWWGQASVGVLPIFAQQFPQTALPGAPR